MRITESFIPVEREGAMQLQLVPTRKCAELTDQEFELFLLRGQLITAAKHDIGNVAAAYEAYMKAWSES